MEIIAQTCESCGSAQVGNLLVRQPGQPQTVYVNCGCCGGLIARYRLSEYYRHGADFESWLRSPGPAATESGRITLADFDRLKESVLDEFAAVMQAVVQETASADSAKDTAAEPEL